MGNSFERKSLLCEGLSRFMHKCRVKTASATL